MAARCRKFVPNLFNKTKCQSCFGAKEAHTAEALESSKAARKISKCAYLFVSPDLDFSNPLQRTKRWQRRFFILYDDGELTYSVDDNPGTIPQGSVDMNKCTDVFDAEEKTGHEYSIGVSVPNQPSSYVKGTSKDEIQRWFDVLVMYPRSLTIKTKRSPGSKPDSPVIPDEPPVTEVDYDMGGGGVARHMSYYPSGTEKSVSDDEDADSVHSKDSGDTYDRPGRTRGRYKQRDVRRSKSEVRPSDLRLAEDEYNKSQSKFPKDKNIDGLPVRKAGEPETFSSVRSMKHRKAAKSHQHSSEVGKAQHNLSAAPPAASSGDTVDTPSASGGAGAADIVVNPLNRRLSIPGMSTVSKAAPGHKSLARAASAAEPASGGAFTAFVYPPATSTPSNALTDANETDELKIAKSEHARKTLEKSPIVRKGWLLVRQDIHTNVWSKHWFVLCGTSLSYYKDAKAEETNQLDGVIDVANAYEVTTVKAERNHGFKIKTKEGEYILSAMTSGIRRNWIDAVEGIIAEIRRAQEKTARQDMGFVFESPIRSPRTPSGSANRAVTPTPIAPVVPDSSSRVNSALRSKHASSKLSRRREMAERRRETGDDRPLEELYDVVNKVERKDSACSDTEREVSALTSKQDAHGHLAAAATPSPLRHSTDVTSQPPKSPSAFVSPSQRIKEKSRAKTPPRARSPPPPASLVAPISHHGSAPQSPTPRREKHHSPAPHRDTVHGSTPHRDTAHGSTPHRDTVHGSTPHRDIAHGSTPHIDTVHGSTPHRGMAHGSTPHMDIAHSSSPHREIVHGSTPHRETVHGSTPHREIVHGSSPHREAIHGSTPHRETPHSSTSHTSTPVDRVLLLPTGNSSDENDDSLSAKLIQSHKQVQHLEQQVQDTNSTVRKQAVEIESLQTKLDLTTSQLRDMETALTHSAQNLNKERRNTSRLTEALEAMKRDKPAGSDYQEKCALLERQLQDATQKFATQEVKIGMVNSLEEQLQIRTSKLATLEKVLGNTRRHLQDAVENARETELHYQTKIDELEHDFEEERVELQEKLHKMEERLDALVTESNNSVNADLSGQLMKEKSQNVQRLEELVKEQKGKIDQLTEEMTTTRQQNEELQCYKDRAAVNQNQLDTVQQEYTVLHSEFESMRNDLEAVSSELSAKDSKLTHTCQENVRLADMVNELQEKCRQTQGQAVEGDVHADIHGVEALTLELNNTIESSRVQIGSLQQSNADLVEQLRMANAQLQSLNERCSNAELELKKERSKPPVPLPASAVVAPTSSGGFTLTQLVEMISAVARCCERMTESAVAMLAGEMIETDIKATINFNQEQRGALGNKTVEQLSKKFSGVRQRLNYIVKHSVSKKQFDNLQIDKDGLAQQLSVFEANGSVKPLVESPAASSPGSADYLTALLEQCRAEILCISSDITRLDISHVESRLQSLNTALNKLDREKDLQEFSLESSVASYCNKLAVQAAATFELARSIADGVDISQAVASIENCLQSTSGLVTSIEDLSLRNYALLVSERLLISHELDHLILTGQWKGFMDNQSEEFTTKAIVSETLQRIDAFCMSRGQPLSEIFLNSCINNLLQQNVGGRPSLDMLRNETSLISSIFKGVDQSLERCVRGYVSMYTTELANFGTVEIGEVESLASSMTNKLCKQIKQLAHTGSLCNISTDWLHQQICTVCERAKGLEAKDMPAEMAELALKVAMFENKFNASSSLIMKRQTSTLSQSLVSEACKLAGLSTELAKKSAIVGSVEAKIASLAHRLDRTDRLLATCTSHYSDNVQQVMREVVHSMQTSLLKHQLGIDDYPASPKEQALSQEVDSLSLKLKQANQRGNKLVNISQHEKAVEALHDEMSLLRVEHSTELDESKRDMKMVVKSVKAEEYRMATQLTKQISDLESQLADEQRAHRATQQKLEQNRPGSVPLEDHNILKDKVRDLENCLHEMQEEFDEELYQERRAHLSELDKCRAELLNVINKADNQQLLAEDVQQQYEIVIDKLKAEQASLQQWIDDIREAHRDEMDALRHERDDALADEVMATQTALESMRSNHHIELEQERGKVKELEEKASRLLQAERDLLLHTRENDNKEERINLLNGKLSTANRKLAKLELNSSKAGETIKELSLLNKQLSERNSLLVDKFTQEISNVSGRASSPSNSQQIALRAQIETLTEKLKLEELSKNQLQDEIETLKATFEHQLQQKEEDAKLEVSVSVSPAEEMLIRRKLRARSPSPHVRHSSPPVLTAGASPKSSSSKNSSELVPPQSRPTVSSPRRTVDKSYDLSRSKSAATVSKPSLMPRSKRLSNPDDSSRQVMLDTNDRGFQQYQKSGGMSIADRMRKFT